MRGGGTVTNASKINDNRTSFKRKKFGWLIHLVIFLIIQFVFFRLDGYSGWHIFRLNPQGEWAVDKLSPLVEWFQLYEYEYFNLVTVGWGVVLIIDILASLYSYRAGKKGTINSQ